MKRLAVIAFVGVFLISFSGQSVLAEKKDMKMYWKEGIRFESSDKAFKFKFGGRIMNDWAFMNGDDSVKAAVGDLQDATTEFRRARFYISGIIYDKIFFKAQYDFTDGDVDFKDVYLGLKKLPGVGKLTIGHFKEHIGLENLTSSKYITLMERANITAFIPSYNNGIGVFKSEMDDRLTWAVGVFLDTNAYGDKDGAESSFASTARITGLPWYSGKDKLLHLGFAFSYREAKDGSVRFRERPESHTAPRFVDTGSFDADSENRFGFEAAIVHGPLSVQGEYMGTKVDTLSGSDPTFSGYYAYVSYFLTGEHRVYKKSAGKFGRVKPKANFGKNGGAGAWEIAFRYSGLDLTDKAITGGELNDITLGVNWYLNPVVRVMGNYIRADLDGVGKANIFQTRFQIEW